MSDYPPIPVGSIMCYRCQTVFEPPTDAKYATSVTCPGCGSVDSRYEHRCHPSDPLRHTSGWPYDDPRVPCDC